MALKADRTFLSSESSPSIADHYRRVLDKLQGTYRTSFPAHRRALLHVFAYPRDLAPGPRDRILHATGSSKITTGVPLICCCRLYLVHGATLQVQTASRGAAYREQRTLGEPRNGRLMRLTSPSPTMCRLLRYARMELPEHDHRYRSTVCSRANLKPRHPASQ